MVQLGLQLLDPHSVFFLSLLNFSLEITVHLWPTQHLAYLANPNNQFLVIVIERDVVGLLQELFFI